MVPRTSYDIEYLVVALSEVESFAMPGLPDYLREKSLAFDKLKRNAATPGFSPSRLEARVEAAGRTGIRRIRIRDFQIVSDAATTFAGYNLGPTSPEILLGALGSCLTHTYLIQAAVHQITLHEVTVLTNGQVDARAGLAGHDDVPVYPHELSYHVTLTTDASEAVVATLNAAVERSCPILNLLRRGNTVTGGVTVTTEWVNQAEVADSAV